MKTYGGVEVYLHHPWSQVYMEVTGQHHAMNTYGGVEVYLHHPWSQVYMEVTGQLHVPAALSPGEITRGTHWIGAWVGPTTGLDAEEERKISPCRESKPGPPVRSQSLYRLNYPDS
jgi:hypothetical protein